MVKVVADLFAVQKAGGARRKSFEFADARVDTLDDGRGVQAGGQFREDCLAHGARRPSPG